MYYWRYETGDLEGWTCWAYPNDNAAFEKWMAGSCTTASIRHRFNSGNPMYTVHITNEKEAMLFQLAWDCS